MSVQAKFKCGSVTKFQFGSKITMNAVVDNSGANKDFTTATPSGQFEMSISDGVPAENYFKPGAVYSMLITEETE